MSDPDRFIPDVLLALAVVLSLGCGPRETPPPTVEPAAEPAPAAAPETRRYAFVVTSDDGEFRSEGTIEEGSLFSVAEADGEGLGFRPTGVEQSASGVRVVALDVVRLHGAGSDDRSEEPLTSLQVVDGGTGTVDPLDGEGTFTVQVSTEGSAPP